VLVRQAADDRAFYCEKKPLFRGKKRAGALFCVSPRRIVSIDRWQMPNQCHGWTRSRLV